jgi:hypothetical protein
MGFNNECLVVFFLLYLWYLFLRNNSDDHRDIDKVSS